MKLFHKLSTPILTLAAACSVFLMGLDLILIDPVPLIDEVFLLFMTAGSTSELLARFRSMRRLPGVDSSLPRRSLREQRSVQETLGSLSGRVTALIARARLLESQGHPERLFQPLARLPEQIAEQLRGCRDHEAHESRRENDPWQIRRGIAKLEKAISRRQIGRPTPKLERMRAELIDLQQHEISTLDRLAKAGELKDRLLALSSQVDALGEDLANLADDGLVQGGAQVLALPDLDPAIAAVAHGLQDFALAQAEVDGVLVSGAQVDSAARVPVTPMTRAGS